MGSRRLLSPSDVAAAAQLACLLEASASKPGNVSPGRDFEDLGYTDFLASAAVIGAPLAGAADRPLGQTVRLAVEKTALWARSNTNLGIVLLLAPLARAALVGANEAEPAALQTALGQTLRTTTVEDAREVYAAIRLAGPGGLGRVRAEDVAGEPRVTLLEAMELAADRDGIAREYATSFAMTFGTGVPALEGARRDGLSWDDAVTETFLTVLAAFPDTHIVRRSSRALAESVSERARRVLVEGGVRSPAGRRAIEAMDTALRDGAHQGNPGTTADLTAAAIFVVLLGGGWAPS